MMIYWTTDIFKYILQLIYRMTDRTHQSSKWETLASDSEIEETINSLKKNGIEAFVVENGNVAREKVLKMLPKNAEVFNSTSVTLDTIGLSKEIVEGNFNSVRKKFMSMDRNSQG